MTPPDLDPDVIHAKLSAIRELLDDLDSAGEITAGRLAEERILRHAVERILTQLVDLAVGINGHVSTALLGRAPTDYRESFACASEAGILPEDLAERLAPAAGLRNILVHEYTSIDLERVAGAVALARREFGTYVAEVARALLENEAGS